MNTRLFDSLVAKLRKEGRLSVNFLGLKGARIFTDYVRWQYRLSVGILTQGDNVEIVLQGS